MVCRVQWRCCAGNELELERRDRAWVYFLGKRDRKVALHRDASRAAGQVKGGKLVAQSAWIRSQQSPRQLSSHLPLPQSKPPLRPPAPLPPLPASIPPPTPAPPLTTPLQPPPHPVLASPRRPRVKPIVERNINRIARNRNNRVHLAVPAEVVTSGQQRYIDVIVRRYQKPLNCCEKKIGRARRGSNVLYRSGRGSPGCIAHVIGNVVGEAVNVLMSEKMFVPVLPMP